MKNDTGLEATPFKCIQPKSPFVFLTDYCPFRLSKRALFKRHQKKLDGHWMIVKEEWNKINLDVLRNSLLS